jgi:hypothetical protein
MVPFGAVSVCAPRLDASTDDLVFVVAKQLAHQRAELLPLSVFPTVAELNTLVAAAIRTSRAAGPLDAADGTLDVGLAAHTSAPERESIRKLLAEAQAASGTLDLRRWACAAELSAMRAGLLLCGTMNEARRAMLTETHAAPEDAVRELLGDLYIFATSDSYTDLRAAIGVSIQD